MEEIGSSVHSEICRDYMHITNCLVKVKGFTQKHIAINVDNLLTEIDTLSFKVCRHKIKKPFLNSCVLLWSSWSRKSCDGYMKEVMTSVF